MTADYLRAVTDAFFQSHDSVDFETESNKQSNESGQGVWKDLVDKLDELVFIIDNNDNIIEANEPGKSLISSLPGNFCNYEQDLVSINDIPYQISSVPINNIKRACIARAINV
jgi:hypothetical protein